MPENAAASLRRILLLIPELADDQRHDVAAVAASLGVDRDTLLHDLTSLAERYDDPGGFVEGVQIYLDSRGVSLRSNHFLRPMRLTLGELAALELGLALLRAERPPEEHAVLDRARERLRKAIAALPGESLDGARTASGSVADAVTLAGLRRAMRARHRVRLRYRGSRHTDSTERVVCPFACAFASGAWYLVAHCETSDGMRVFRLDRIESMEETAERYDVPPDFKAEQVIREGKVLWGDVRERVRIRYGPAVARWIAEREGKRLDSDGSITLEHPLADPTWVVRHVLQYGPDAEVLEPPAAREAVVAALRRIEA